MVSLVNATSGTISKKSEEIYLNLELHVKTLHSCFEVKFKFPFFFSLHEWAPYMPEDVSYFIKELYQLLKRFLVYMNETRHTYSAR